MRHQRERNLQQFLQGLSRTVTQFCYISLLVITTLLVLADNVYGDPFAPPSLITVTMHRLDYPGGGDTGISCTISPRDRKWGCTWFDEDHYPQEQVRPYPYDVNPITISIENDYLLDVVPQEMGTYYHPTALQAQATLPAPMPTGTSTGGAPSTTPPSSRLSSLTSSKACLR